MKSGHPQKIVLIKFDRSFIGIVGPPLKSPHSATRADGVPHYSNFMPQLFENL